MYGHWMGSAIGLGYVEDPEAGGVVDGDFIAGGGYELEAAGVRFPARASLRPLYDPKAERIKA